MQQENKVPRDFSKLTVGAKQVKDATIDLGTYQKVNPNYGNKAFVLKAIYDHNYDVLREISKYFYEASGIYYRLCNYLAKLYRYDWYVTPYIENPERENQKKVLKDFNAALAYLDNSDVKRLCDKIALDIIKEGAFYGIIVDFNDRFSL